MIEISNQTVNVSEPFTNNEKPDITHKKWGCLVCGEDSWCGSDGCPLEPN